MPLTTPALLAILPATLSRLSRLDALATLPEEEVWLGSRKSPDTRRVYAQDIQHFCRALGITSRDELRRVDRKAVIAWERSMREVQAPSPGDHSAALIGPVQPVHASVRYGVVMHNPVQAVERPAINRWGRDDPRLYPPAGTRLTRRPRLGNDPGAAPIARCSRSACRSACGDRRSSG